MAVADIFFLDDVVFCRSRLKVVYFVVISQAFDITKLANIYIMQSINGVIIRKIKLELYFNSNKTQQKLEKTLTIQQKVKLGVELP